MWNGEMVIRINLDCILWHTHPWKELRKQVQHGLQRRSSIGTCRFEVELQLVQLPVLVH